MSGCKRVKANFLHGQNFVNPLCNMLIAKAFWCRAVEQQT